MNTTKYNGIFTTHDMDTAMTSGYGICDGIGIGFGCGTRARIKLLEYTSDDKAKYIRNSPASYKFWVFARKVLIVKYDGCNGTGEGDGTGDGFGIHHHNTTTIMRKSLNLTWCNEVIPTEVAINEIHT